MSAYEAPDNVGQKRLAGNDIPTKFQKSAPSPLRRLAEGRERLLKYNQCSIFPSPSPFGEGRGEALVSLLPRGNAGSGDCPGAAAITIIISFLFSSPRGASGWEPEFLTPTSPNAGVGNSGSRRAVRPAHSLPVINQSTFHQGSFVPLTRGTRFALANQGVNLPKGTSKLERRYVTNSI